MFENRKIKIAIAGIGGIGGYIGGKLAHYYSLFENVDIIFIAKGDTIKAIEKSGLELISNEITYKCKPTLISNKPDEIGEVDLFILCSKTFSVPSILKEFATCLTANSTIITTQNTINGKETIMPYLSNNSTVLEGCIYISSSKVSATKIQHITAQAKLYFGTEGELNKNGEEIAKILNYAGIDAIYTTNISRLLWKKFMFASPAAIVTALYQITMAEILENRETEYLYINLIAEIMELAKAKDVPVDELTVLNNISILNNFKGYVKSSFQLDLENNRHSEINELVKHVIEEAKLFNISTPFFDKALTELIEKYSLLEIN